METLRKAMHEEGPVPGIISLTVARRIEPNNLVYPGGNLQPKQMVNSSDLMHQVNQNKQFLPPSSRDSMSSLPTSSDDEIVREYAVSSAPNNKFAVHPGPSFKMPSTSSLAAGRNPVIDRLMGKDGSASASLVPTNLRNESYYMATDHETWNASMLQQHMLPGGAMNMETDSPIPISDQVMIETPATTTDNDDNTTVTGEDHANTRESLTSLVEFYAPFSRDNPGRQSMSEKRHATLDAKATDTYQKRKKVREELDKQKQQQQQLWKKSASLESLQMHDVERRRRDQSAYQRAASVRVSRNRGCNESFRAAVDRSYEKDFPEAAKNVAFNIQDLEQDQNAANAKVVMRRSKSGGHNEERKKNRNSKLLRGLGTMFKIGHNSEKNSQKEAARKSMPLPDALTSASSLGSTNSADSSTRVRPPSSVKTSGSDIGDPNWPQHLPQNQQPEPQQLQHHQHPRGHHYGYHPRSHSQPRYQTRTSQSEMYEYYPTAMMRPGSRVGIADPAQLSSDTADYDVIQRLQNTHVQPPAQYQPPPPQRQMFNYYQAQQQQHPAYLQQYSMYPPHPYAGGYAVAASQHHQPIIAHPRQGSNMSSGSSTNNNPAVTSGRPPRPKSNYYEYEMYNNNPASFASASSSNATTSSSSQYPSSDLHHPTMYSLPRSSSYGHHPS